MGDATITIGPPCMHAYMIFDVSQVYFFLIFLLVYVKLLLVYAVCNELIIITSQYSHAHMLGCRLAGWGL